MNDLGMALVWSAIQFTLLAAVAAVLTSLLFRRRPSAAALVLLASLGAGALLPLIALSPLPAWWRVVQPPGEGESSPTPAIAEVPLTADPPSADPGRPQIQPPGSAVSEGGLSFSLQALRRTWAGFRQPPVDDVGWRWPAVAALLAVAGALAGLARLLLGLWVVRAWRRRSVAIDDASLLRLADTVTREMGGRRPVVLRECADLPTPATVGWRSPLILLPADWRGWSEAERRAVLAHELAHIHRADCAAWLVARVSVALHFYHPLVYWLAGRLRLQQELAADALAAPFAGGRDTYLVALSRLALRQDRRVLTRPVPAFLSAPGTLMRRIQMLRVTNGPSPRSLSWAARCLLPALIGVVALGMTALRGPASTGDDETPGASAAEQPQPAEQAPAPFDLSYLPANAKAIYAIRPAAVFGRPELKELANKLNREGLDRLARMMKLRPGILKIEEIEQLVGHIVFHTDPKGGPTPTSVMATMSLVRTARDVDWVKELKPLGATEVRYHGKVYYKFAPGAMPSLGGMCYYTPDRRTLLLQDEEHLRRLLSKGSTGPRKGPWMEDWKKVERGVIAIALIDSDRSWLEKRPKPKGVLDVELRRAVMNSDTVVCGIDLAKGLELQVLTRSANEGRARQVARSGMAVLAEAEKDLPAQRAALKHSQHGKLRAEQKIGYDLLEDLLKHSRLRRDGSRVTYQARTEHQTSSVFAAILSGEMGL
jgi:beta-lactamase regulating signal transducer with metallopeptidase domain